MKLVHGIWLPDADTHFAGQLANSRVVDGKATYQYGKYAAALRATRRRRHAVDVGAHVGLWSRVMALDFERVTAFEPVEGHRACFARNVTAGNVALLPNAVGALQGNVLLALPADNSGNACISDAGESAAMITLDEAGLGAPVDLLKIDVEGWERDVIAGAEATIRRDRPVVVVEQKPGHAERYGIERYAAAELLKSWGMREISVISGDHILAW